MTDELIRLDTTIIDIDSLINKVSTAEEAKVLFTVKDVIYSQQRYFTNVQAVRHGRWVNEYLDDDVWWADCTNCKNDTHSKYGRVSTYAYCPNCGARMIKDGEQND